MLRNCIRLLIGSFLYDRGYHFTGRKMMEWSIEELTYEREYKVFKGNLQRKPRASRIPRPLKRQV